MNKAAERVTRAQAYETAYEAIINCAESFEQEETYYKKILLEIHPDEENKDSYEYKNMIQAREQAEIYRKVAEEIIK